LFLLVTALVAARTHPTAAFAQRLNRYALDPL
jgi:hypothetical protein